MKYLTNAEIAAHELLDDTQGHKPRDGFGTTVCMRCGVRLDTDPKKTDKELLIALISEVRNALIPARHDLEKMESEDERILRALEGVQRALDYTSEINRLAGGS